MANAGTLLLPVGQRGIAVTQKNISRLQCTVFSKSTKYLHTGHIKILYDIKQGNAKKRLQSWKMRLAVQKYPLRS